MSEHQPARNTLFTSKELLDGFDPADPQSFVRTWDFRQFMYFVGAGAGAPTRFEDIDKQAMADADIEFALHNYIHDASPSMVGIMGGHSLPRDSAAYALVVDLARRLTLAGYLVVTGGGPGAMEAGHLGAAFAHSTPEALARALERLRAVASLPNCNDLVLPDGTLAPGKQAQVASIHAWMLAAVEANEMVGGRKGPSLAVPTWLYGQEPTTPFATAYAKFFQNSIREETLITNGSVGMLYAQGGGGTLREIFQDVERNYYIDQTKPEQFVPMIFVDPGDYWRTTAVFDANDKPTTRGVKLDVVLDQIFHLALAGPCYRACKSKVLFTTSFDEIETLLSGSKQSAAAALTSMLSGDAERLLKVRRS